jgi:hypothetical protein
MPGNANSGRRKEKLFYEALKLELSGRDDRNGLRAIARNLLDVALDTTHKDMLAASREVADRLDGKPAQALIGGDDDDNPLTIIQKIELVAPGLVRNITD